MDSLYFLSAGYFYIWISMSITKVFLTENGWAYDGVYTHIKETPGIDDTNEKLWTFLGAILMELERTGIREVVIYNDTRLIEEWHEDITFLNPFSQKIAARLKDRDGLASKFLTLELQKLDSITINSKINELRLTS